ncbi:SOS response-associated peptidase [Croceibacterium ferulae]|uniref:SOS response-associated peptidase n=1 Tax=Croceibacterium ferulae TaxID=1854641 RepID=UPI000EB18C1E|nr:SOS response-associated peptidase family protein [Croceibacterium ferulae]
MCNLYRLASSHAEVARLFRGAAIMRGNMVEEVYPGYPGLVLASGVLRSMTWGFPRSETSKRTGKPLKPRPVNNTRSENLGSPMWRDSFVARRCLIPLTEFAEAEGEKGTMTRTWFALPDQPIFTAAGIWRDTDEWGPAYSMLMTEACIHAVGIHDRMPVILPPTVWDCWTDGTPHEALQLCRPYEGEVTIRRTADRWSTR